MMKKALDQKELPKTVILISAIISGLIFSLLLFYFDEGRNSLLGLFDEGNAGALIFYTLPIMAIAILVYELLGTYLKNLYALVISFVISPVIGVLIFTGFVILVTKVLA